MQPRLRAFTLIELLFVLAIILVLAGLLFPVFSAAKQAAKRSTCASNFRNAQLASQIYIADYDERLMIVNYRPGMVLDSASDRTWVQLILPYVRSFSVFKCPSDFGRQASDEASFDQDLFPGDTDSRFYTASMRTNIGYNYLYLSPIYRSPNGPWTSQPRTPFEAADLSRTILFVDSVWAVDEAGRPYGGGSWLIVPPCRYLPAKQDSFDLKAMKVYTPGNDDGWASEGFTPEAFGFTWPWHNETMNVMNLDGHVKALTRAQITQGCVVMPKWGGVINDPGNYNWDLR